jgi:hypothetical protein
MPGIEQWKAKIHFRHLIQQQSFIKSRSLNYHKFT